MTMNTESGLAVGSEAANVTALPAAGLPLTQISGAAGDGRVDHLKRDARRLSVDPSVIDQIVMLARRRRQWKRAIQKLELQEHAICRGIRDGDRKAGQALRSAILKGEPVDAIATISITPLAEARRVLEAHCKPVDKELRKMARQLPVWAGFAEGIRGFGDLRLALIVGEAGRPLSDYRSPAALWKRLGLAVIDGGRQRKVAGDAALLHGYSPERRAVAWNLGGELIKGGDVKYRAVYDARKEYELPRVETKGHAHNRATRYMTKRVIRDLWSAWRAAENGVQPGAQIVKLGAERD